MTTLLDAVLVLQILTCFLLLGSSRLGTCIHMMALQGVLTGIVSYLIGGPDDLTPRVLIIGGTVIILKGYVFPHLLWRALRESHTSREVKPFVGYAASLFGGMFFVLASFWLDAKFNLPVHFVSSLIVPVAFFIMMTGLFLIVSRRTAVNQVLGYIVLENGIYTFGLAIAQEIPVLIEMGALMDMFVAVFVMGIAIYRINREFDHIDADRLNTLKG